MSQSAPNDLYERPDWYMFRHLPTLAQKAGCGVDNLAAVLVKELVDNALDKTGGARIGLLRPNGFWVEDDGPGFPGTIEDLAALFSINRPLLSSKVLRLPTRGALGNGLRVVAGAALATGGHLTVRTNGQMVHLTPRDDGTTTATLLGSAAPAGTWIAVHLGGALPVTESDLLPARGAINLAARGTGYKGASSPHWYSPESFYELMQAAGARPVRAVVATLEGCSGAKAGRLTAGLHDRPAASLSRDEARAVLRSCRLSTRPVNPSRLGAVGPLREIGEIGEPRNPAYGIARGEIDVERGVSVPAVVEVWFESVPHLIGNDIHIEALVNRSPIIGKLVAQYDRRDREIGLFGCQLANGFSVGRFQPDAVSVNIQCPAVPRTSDGKEPDLRPFIGLLAAAIKKAGRVAQAQQAAERRAWVASVDAENGLDDAAKARIMREAAQQHLGHGLQEKTIALWLAIWRVLEERDAIRVRSVAYLLESMEVIAKTEAAFERVGQALTDMRRAGVIPYEKIVEGHRERVKIQTFDDMPDFLSMVKNSYNRDPWTTQPRHVEVWVEKDGLADIIAPICERYRVHYIAVKGQSSVTLLHKSAQEMKATGKKTIILYFGDFDGRGLNISDTIEKDLAHFGADFEFRRVAVTQEQIAQYGLPTRPSKKSDSTHKAFVEKYGDACVELDALDVIDTDLLPSLVEQAIRSTIDWRAWEREMDAEQAEREKLAKLIDAAISEKGGDGYPVMRESGA